MTVLTIEAGDPAIVKEELKPILTPLPQQYIKNNQFDLSKIEKDFRGDLDRGTSITYQEHGQEMQNVKSSANNIKDREQQQEKIDEDLQKTLTDEGLSDEQINYIRAFSSQHSLTGIGGGIQQYVAAEMGEKMLNIQPPNGALVHLETNKDGELIFKTQIRVLCDKPPMEGYNFDDYGKAMFPDIESKDYMIISAEVNLGKKGNKDFLTPPKARYEFAAKGELAEQIVQSIYEDHLKDSIIEGRDFDEVEKSYNDFINTHLEKSGDKEIYKEEVKGKIKECLEAEPAARDELAQTKKILSELNVTKELLPEMIVDKLDKIIKDTNKKDKEQQIKTLADNVGEILGQPKGYIKILIKDVAREMEEQQKSEGQKLSKENFIKRIANNIKLIYYEKFKGQDLSQDKKRYLPAPQKETTTSKEKTTIDPPGPTPPPNRNNKGSSSRRFTGR